MRTYKDVWDKYKNKKFSRADKNPVFEFISKMVSKFIKQSWENVNKESYGEKINILETKSCLNYKYIGKRKFKVGNKVKKILERKIHILKKNLLTKKFKKWTKVEREKLKGWINFIICIRIMTPNLIYISHYFGYIWNLGCYNYNINSLICEYILILFYYIVVFIVVFSKDFSISFFLFF